MPYQPSPQFQYDVQSAMNALVNEGKRLKRRQNNGADNSLAEEGSLEQRVTRLNRVKASFSTQRKQFETLLNEDGIDLRAESSTFNDDPVYANGSDTTRKMMEARTLPQEFYNEMSLGKGQPPRERAIHLAIAYRGTADRKNLPVVVPDFADAFTAVIDRRALSDADVATFGENALMALVHPVTYHGTNMAEWFTHRPGYFLQLQKIRDDSGLTRWNSLRAGRPGPPRELDQDAGGYQSVARKHLEEIR